MPAERFTIPASIPTMVTGEELDYLYRLTRDFWPGEGDIVEMGPWLGGSTWALAEGMEANPRRSDGARLHVIDNFVWQPFMAERANLEIEPGGSFRHAFERNLAPKQDLLVVHQAALPDDESCELVHDVGFIDGGLEVPALAARALPAHIAIAFVDGAKSWQGLLHLMNALAPRLRPDASVLVFQDFKNWSSYWVPLFVARLLEAEPDCLELVDVLARNSVSFRVKSDLGEVIQRSVPSSLEDMDAEHAHRLFARTAESLRATGDRAGASVAGLSEVVFLGSQGLWDRAGKQLRRVERSWPFDGEALSQLERTRAWFDRQHPPTPGPSLRIRLINARLRALRKLRGRS